MDEKKMVLTLKKKWFDLILSGVKTEEYREIKPYWTTRLTKYFDLLEASTAKTILFRNGYGYDKPEFKAECTLRTDNGKEEWGAEKDKQYYVLAIRKIYDARNIK